MYKKTGRKKTSGIQVRRYEDGTDNEIIESLKTLGMSENASKILEYIYRAGEAQKFDFESAFSLSKTKVSLAIKELRGYGWIKEDKDEHGDYEVPITIYSPKTNFNDMVNELEIKLRKNFDDKNTLFQKLLLKNGYKKIVYDLIEQMHSLNLKENSVKILACFKNIQVITNNDIQKITGLQQSQISIAVKELKSKGWINENPKNLGVGRPHKVYSLISGFEDIIQNIQKKEKASFNNSLYHINRLRKLTSGSL